MKNMQLTFFINIQSFRDNKLIFQHERENSEPETANQKVEESSKTPEKKQNYNENKLEEQELRNKIGNHLSNISRNVEKFNKKEISEIDLLTVSKDLLEKITPLLDQYNKNYGEYPFLDDNSGDYDEKIVLSSLISIYGGHQNFMYALKLILATSDQNKPLDSLEKENNEKLFTSVFGNINKPSHDQVRNKIAEYEDILSNDFIDQLNNLKNLLNINK